MDISRTIEADSTQINADDLSAPVVVTVTGVSKGTADQPVNIEVAEFPGRAYRPCKSMRRVLVAAWGPQASEYVGRKMQLFNDTTVKWGGQAVGGVRISALSHIDKPLDLPLTETRGKRKPFHVEPLAVSYKPIPATFADRINAGGLSSEEQAKALAYLDKLTDADPALVDELRGKLDAMGAGDE